MGKDGFRQIRQVGILTTIPFILAAGPVIGYFAGAWIDRKLDVSPYATAGCIVLGFIASARETIRMIREASKV